MSRDAEAITFTAAARAAGYSLGTVSSWIARDQVPGVSASTDRSTSRRLSHREAMMVLLFARLVKSGLAARYATDIVETLVHQPRIPRWMVVCFRRNGFAFAPSNAVGAADAIAASDLPFSGDPAEGWLLVDMVQLGSRLDAALPGDTDEG